MLMTGGDRPARPRLPVLSLRLVVAETHTTEGRWNDDRKTRAISISWSRRRLASRRGLFGKLVFNWSGYLRLQWRDAGGKRRLILRRELYEQLRIDRRVWQRRRRGGRTGKRLRLDDRRCRRRCDGR
jgi:hypothetical protein